MFDVVYNKFICSAILIVVAHLKSKKVKEIWNHHGVFFFFFFVSRRKSSWSSIVGVTDSYRLLCLFSTYGRGINISIHRIPRQAPNPYFTVGPIFPCDHSRNGRTHSRVARLKHWGANSRLSAQTTDTSSPSLARHLLWRSQIVLHPTRTPGASATRGETRCGYPLPLGDLLCVLPRCLSPRSPSPALEPCKLCFILLI